MTSYFRATKTKNTECCSFKKGKTLSWYLSIQQMYMVTLYQGVYKFNQANFQEISRRFQEGF